jgi:hypothetical protein
MGGRRCRGRWKRLANAGKRSGSGRRGSFGADQSRGGHRPSACGCRSKSWRPPPRLVRLPIKSWRSPPGLVRLPIKVVAASARAARVTAEGRVVAEGALGGHRGAGSWLRSRAGSRSGAGSSRGARCGSRPGSRSLRKGGESCRSGVGSSQRASRGVPPGSGSRPTGRVGSPPEVTSLI